MGKPEHPESDKRKDQESPWTKVLDRGPTEFLWSIWEEEKGLLVWEDGEEGIVCGVDGGQESPETVYLRDVVSEKRGDPSRCCREETKLGWPVQVGGHIEQRHGSLLVGSNPRNPRALSSLRLNMLTKHNPLFASNANDEQRADPGLCALPFPIPRCPRPCTCI